MRYKKLSIVGGAVAVALLTATAVSAVRERPDYRAWGPGMMRGPMMMGPMMGMRGPMMGPMMGRGGPMMGRGADQGQIDQMFEFCRRMMSSWLGQPQAKPNEKSAPPKKPK